MDISIDHEFQLGTLKITASGSDDDGYYEESVTYISLEELAEALTPYLKATQEFDDKLLDKESES